MLKDIYLENGEEDSPKAGKLWYVLTGATTHKTGTTTVVTWTNGQGNVIMIVAILTGVADTVTPLFHTGANTEESANWQPIIMMQGDKVGFVGDAAASVNMRVLEVDEWTAKPLSPLGE